MFDMLDAHPLTFVIVMAAVLVPPFHTLATFVFSGASPRKGVIVGALFLAWGAFMVAAWRTSSRRQDRRSATSSSRCSGSVRASYCSSRATGC